MIDGPDDESSLKFFSIGQKVAPDLTCLAIKIQELLIPAEKLGVFLDEDFKHLHTVDTYGFKGIKFQRLGEMPRLI